MKIIKWNELKAAEENSFFNNGTGISVGSFDGFHSGHQKLIDALLENCKKNDYKSGIVTFTKPLPSFKHSQDYVGDILSINQKLELLEKMGIDFVILVEFNQDFARNTGESFFSKLIQFCNLKYLVEGVDFKCGYKGATGMKEIEQFCELNKIDYTFVEPVFYKNLQGEEERISSSNIRKMVSEGAFHIVNQLLYKPYKIDLRGTDFTFGEKNQLIIKKVDIFQVLPILNREGNSFSVLLETETGTYDSKLLIGEENIVLIMQNNLNIKAFDKLILLSISFI